MKKNPLPKSHRVIKEIVERIFEAIREELDGALDEAYYNGIEYGKKHRD